MNVKNGKTAGVDYIKKFLAVFDIPTIVVEKPIGPIPIYGSYIPKDVPRIECGYVEVDREITDKIYLGLIFILNSHSYIPNNVESVDEMKQAVLKELILLYQNFSCAISSDYPFEYQQTAREIKEQIQELFKV